MVEKMSKPAADQNVEDLRELLKARAAVGLAKYGVTTMRDNLSVRDWLHHAIEETLDNAIYLRAAIRKIDAVPVLDAQKEFQQKINRVMPPLPQDFGITQVGAAKMYGEALLNHYAVDAQKVRDEALEAAAKLCEFWHISGPNNAQIAADKIRELKSSPAQPVAPRGQEAIDALIDQAQELDMGYGPPTTLEAPQDHSEDKLDMVDHIPDATKMVDGEREVAPPNNLPNWAECKLRVENSKFINKRVADGGHGAEQDSKLAKELHRFIHEYDEKDPYRSSWFLHRLEKLLDETRIEALQSQQAAAVG